MRKTQVIRYVQCKGDHSANCHIVATTDRRRLESKQYRKEKEKEDDYILKKCRPRQTIRKMYIKDLYRPYFGTLPLI